MSLSSEKMRELTELAMVDIEDARRLRFAALLPTAPEEVRAYWKALEREEEILRVCIGAGLGTPEAPRTLEAALFAIPMNAPPTRRVSWREISIPWPVAAGIIIALFGIGWYLYQAGDRPTTQMSVYPAAPKNVMDNVRALAVNDHLVAAPLEVKGNNSAVVIAALQAENTGRIPFGIVMPGVGADYRLLGGSIVPFGKEWAIYTRWEHQGEIYSLYQFAPESVGLPHQFSREVGIQAAGSAKSKGMFTSVWFAPPDGNTSWAVAWNSDSIGEPFSGCGD